MEVRYTDLPWTDDLPGALRHLQQNSPHLVWLDDADPTQPQASLIALHPVLRLVQHANEQAELHAHEGLYARHASAWNLWRFADEQAPAAAHEGALGPGWIGYLGFELAAQLERLPPKQPDPLGMPAAVLGYFPDVIQIRHDERRVRLVSAPPTPWDAARTSVSTWQTLWSEACERPLPAPPRPATTLRWDWDRETYLTRVRRVLDYIAAGDIYQANLAQRASLTGLPQPLEAYVAIRDANPAAYGALLASTDAAVLSHSPELFLSCKDGHVLTRPIKGTRPRGDDAVEDKALADDLLASEKEAAELAMIVDLHRNDLGRVCRLGSVRVPEARRVEQHPSVIHTVADVIGVLADGQYPLDLLQACFPAGSISGVPKIRALEIIAELEPYDRGAYTGTVLNLTCGASLQANVAIRTLQQRGEAGVLWFGGGIVTDSDPQAEYIETFAKAAGILRGLGLQDGVQQQGVTRA